MKNYKYENGVFVIKNFDRQKPFSSFLPGIAGEKGIPIWSFYCNRGQGLGSFGIENKNSPILEFFPANTSYQYISTYGFRSFVKIDGNVYEPFAVTSDREIERNMYVDYSQFKIEEINKTLGLKYMVTYFVVPNENFGALGRLVEIENISGKELNFEVLDGQSTLFPVGVTNTIYKEMSNLMRSWMDVYNLENNIPFFTLRASTNDSSEISGVESGNFVISVDSEGNLLKPIIDAGVVFGYDTSLKYPLGFEEKDLDELLKVEQVTVNKVPCAFATAKVTLKASEIYNINTIIGQTDDFESLKGYQASICKKGYLAEKMEESKVVINTILENVTTKSSSEVFDNYVKQCYLDNLLRGGYPIVFGEGESKKVHYLYSRKHGDPERDYNFFNISPEFYSQGNGNFRDVNQNRRNDILLNPEVGTVNLEMFYSLIQLDGYNPLEVKGYTYKTKVNAINSLKEKYTFIDNELENIISNDFTVGRVSRKLSKLGVTEVDESKFLNDLLENHSEQNLEAKFGEGYWSDHFSYNQDLLDNYLLIYPDKEKDLLYGSKLYRTYESAEIVLPRKDKYTITKQGQVRQYNALKLDYERVEKLGLDVHGTNWLKDKKGDVYYTTLYNKLLLLAATKFLHLDPSGLGIEMEANKPGWNDAMNGLPGLIGSGVSETIELGRIIKYLKEVTSKYKVDVKVLSELKVVLDEISKVLSIEDSFELWKKYNLIKETYRENIRLGITCEEVEVSSEFVTEILEGMLAKVEKALKTAKEIGNGIIPTFLCHEARAFEKTENGVEVSEFELKLLPNFLEAPARYLKVEKDKEVLQSLYKKIKATDIYDTELGMYKTSGSLNDWGIEIGRIRAFTPGWQERESVFLHMTYKYMLGLIKAGLYEEFFEEIKTNFVCFRDPEQYSRNIIENSSFIVTSVNPDKEIRGQGLVARLSGSTSEMLSIWNMMMVGKEWFSLGDELTLKLSPIIPKWMFVDNKLSFRLFSNIEVTYINESGKDTFDENVSVYKYVVDGVEVNSDVLTGELAENVRSNKVKEIIGYLK